jgi:hypothetical protein
MDWIFILAGVTSAWAMLRILGNERERRIEDIAAQLRAKKLAHNAAEEPMLLYEVGSQAPAKPR